MNRLSPAFPLQQTLWRHRAWLLVALAVLFVLIVRVRLRDMPLERDEGEYAYAGQLILQGVPPYKEAYNMKLPGTYAAYAAIMAVFGQSPSGIRLGLALVNGASIVLVFLLGRKLLDNVGVVKESVEALKAERHRLIDALNELKGVEAFDSKANFVLFNTAKPYGEVYEKALSQGLVIKKLGKLLKYENCLRTTVGLPEMNAKLLKALNEYMGD